MSVGVASSTDALEIYVRLLDEGTEVFRPVPAKWLGGDAYELMATADYDPEDEKWEFLPGSRVRTAVMQGDSGAARVAIASLPTHAGANLAA